MQQAFQEFARRIDAATAAVLEFARAVRRAKHRDDGHVVVELGRLAFCRDCDLWLDHPEAH